MRRTIILAASAIVGALIGLTVGWAQRSDVWPELSRLHIVWMTAIGWVAGMVAGVLARRVVPPGRPGPTGRWHRAVRGSLMVVGMAPGALWLTLAVPDGLLHEAGPLGRALGDSRPNIVLIGIDALRADHLGAYGSTDGLTPNLDAFARDATVYEAAYAPSSWTMPSFAALFSGRTASESAVMRGVDEHPYGYFDRAALRSDASLLTERLWSEGYRTAAELTNPFLAAERGWSRCVDFFRNEDGASRDSLVASGGAQGEKVSAHARAWVRLNHREPFLFWVHYLDPHTPYDSPETPDEVWDRYPADWETTRSAWYDEMQNVSPEERSRFQKMCRECYAEEVRYADQCVGELLAELKCKGVYDRSLIVILADHGEELFDHGEFEHGHSMHEEVLRVPLLVKWPRGTSADPVVRQTVSLIELAGTFLDVAGLQNRDGFSGGSLPTADGEPGAVVFSEGVLHGEDQVALTTDEYKVIYHPEVGEFEVYDRRTDRGELRDIAGTGAVNDLRDRLRMLTEEARENRLRQGKNRPTSDLLSDGARQRLHSLGYL